MKYLPRIVVMLSATFVVGCATVATVRQVDVDAWVGQPVIALETHPIFLTIPVVKTQVSDGTEIWNYVNGANIGSCSGGGMVYGKKLDFGSYNQFFSCMQRFAACNNIFYIKNGKVSRYTPTGTGGMRCWTSEELQPNFKGSANVN